MDVVGAWQVSRPCMAAKGRDRSPGRRMTAVEAWPVPWAPYGCRGDVSGPLAPYGCHRGVTGPLGPYGCRKGVPVPWAMYGRRGGVVDFLGPVWPPWGCGWSHGPRMAAVGVWKFPRAPYGRRGAWPVPWASYGCRGSVACPLGHVSPPWGRCRSPLPVWLPWGCGRFHRPRMSAVEVGPVPWASYRRRGGFAGHLGHAWRPWGSGRFPGPSMSAVGE